MADDKTGLLDRLRASLPGRPSACMRAHISQKELAELLALVDAAPAPRGSIVQVEKDSVAMALQNVARWLLRKAESAPTDAGSAALLGAAESVRLMSERETPIPGSKGWAARTKHEERKDSTNGM